MRRAGVVLLTLVLLAVLVGCGDTATRVSTVRALRAATLPSELLVLERKMERLQVNSERYSQANHVQTGWAPSRSRSSEAILPTSMISGYDFLL